MSDYMYSRGICYTGLEDVAWGVPQWLTHASRGKMLVRCSVSEAGCRSSQILELAPWGIPEELLAFRLHWTPEGAEFNTNHNRK